jgi:hypothetical protein
MYRKHLSPRPLHLTWPGPVGSTPAQEKIWTQFNNATRQFFGSCLPPRMVDLLQPLSFMQSPKNGEPGIPSKKMCCRMYTRPGYSYTQPTRCEDLSHNPDRSRSQPAASIRQIINNVYNNSLIGWFSFSHPFSSFSILILFNWKG